MDWELIKNLCTLSLALLIVGDKMGFWKRGNGEAVKRGNGETNRPISPEALSKLTALRKDLDDKYLTREKHADLCMIQCLEIQKHITKVLEEHMVKILEAVRHAGRDGP